MSSTRAIHYRWSDVAMDHPMEKLDRQKIVAERTMLSRVFLHQGCFVPAHEHENEQIALVVSGRVRFGISSTSEPFSGEPS